ncbi:MAG: hypothetical protein AUK49_12450 [Betaproteobacteria bacterium CG2_30_68_42]|nr:MAG: hypothetical protein AUK49_12450 [Betaproteobacteria bacterium CG2_30_68_42]
MHLGHVESQFTDAGHDGLGLVAIGVVDSLGSAFMRSGIEKVVTFDLARFIDQDAQGFASTVQSVGQQGRKSGVQGVCTWGTSKVSSPTRVMTVLGL